MSILMDMRFPEWLEDKMTEKGWSQSELARKSGLTRQAINYYLSDKSKQPDEFALQKLAKAFKIPVEQVYRAAGLLPPANGNDPWVEEMDHKLRQLSPGLREVADRFINSLAESEEAERRKAKPKTKSAGT